MEVLVPVLVGVVVAVVLRVFFTPAGRGGEGSGGPERARWAVGLVDAETAG